MIRGNIGVMWIKCDGGKVINLDRYGRVWIESSDDGEDLRVVADDGHGEAREVVADHLSPDQAERFMRELTIRALHAAEVTESRELRLRL